MSKTAILKTTVKEMPKAVFVTVEHNHPLVTPDTEGKQEANQAMNQWLFENDITLIDFEELGAVIFNQRSARAKESYISVYKYSFIEA